MNADSPNQFHWSSRCIHWLTLIVVIAMFASGLWMVDLDYYHEWYKTAPDWHRSVGFVLMVATFIRLALYALPKPSALSTHTSTERILAKLTKIILLLALFTMFISGYLITTAAGDPLYVFEWFSVPSVLERENLEDLAGTIHEWAAWTLIVLASVHGLAALKHHFIDKDITLKRMIRGTNHEELS